MHNFTLKNYFSGSCIMKSPGIIKLLASIILAVAMWGSAATGYAQQVLRVSAIPDEAPTELQ
ncbi:MAG: hypothetical protein ABI536_00700, partial [Gallionella sp.]